jgi:acyl carrier protein
MKLNELVKEAFNESDKDFTDESRLMSFRDWDSMSHMVFITRLEEVYQIYLDGNEIAAMETIADVKRLIQLKGKMV